MALVVLLVVFAVLLRAAGCDAADRDDNINLLKEEVDKALSVCVENVGDANDTRRSIRHQGVASIRMKKRYATTIFQRPYFPEKKQVHDYQKAINQKNLPRGDANAHFGNLYDHERRDSYQRGHKLSNEDEHNNISISNQNSTSRSFDTNVKSQGGGRSSFSRLLGSQGFKSVRELNFTPGLYYGLARSKRHERLVKKTSQDECLAQCIFTNLQVVDDRAIPQESSLTRALMSAMVSQLARKRESRRLTSCFEEMTEDDENDGCSFANKLERCLMLGFKERKNIYLMRNT